MIDKFFIQTNNTIWDFLSEIGKNKEVYSTLSCMEMDEYRVYFYATKTEIVLLCMDYANVEDGTIEFADKGVCTMRQIDHLKYFRKVLADGSLGKEGKDVRFSPAMELYNHAYEMRKFFALSQQFDLVPAIHLMLLTNSRIKNYPSVVKTWQQDLFGFSVLQNLSGMKDFGYDRIPYNHDNSIEGSDYFNKWIIYLKNRGWFDCEDYCFDWPPPNKKYSWKGKMGHLISDEFKK